MENQYSESYIHGTFLWSRAFQTDSEFKICKLLRITKLTFKCTHEFVLKQKWFQKANLFDNAANSKSQLSSISIDELLFMHLCASNSINEC